ncbi:MAG: M20/M25/M40 family metallo-hydrolase [Acidobacteriota bacterium]
MTRRALSIALLAAVPLSAGGSDAPLAPDIRHAAEALRDKAIAGSEASQWVAGLTDRVGPRLAGSPGDRQATAWGLQTLGALGFANVRAEKVAVKVWQRGAEWGEVVSPQPQRLALTALGGSVPTPEGGLEAEVLEVSSLEELGARPDAARGKIVFFDKKMERASDMAGYIRAVDVRGKGASRAAALGAVGVLIRSVGTDHNRLPHTGGVDYEEGLPRIPAAALSIPDAELLERLGRSGKPVRVRFTLACGDRGTAESANVVGEIPGAEKPKEIVLLGAHLDSWDLGTGAIDDAAGCGIVIEAARLIGELRRRPARTIRVVLFANEENGLAGARAYAKDHEDELSRHAAALEADSGTGRPTGFSWLAGPSAEPAVREIARLLEPVGAGAATGGGYGGADISPLRAAGVPLFSVRQDSSRYFDFHHTANDTFDKIEPESLDRMVAAVATFAYVAASTPEPFERIPEGERALPGS